MRMEQVCPRCKTSSYHNPNMKLMVNECGHKLCEMCVDSVFIRPSAPCPECHRPLKRSQFRLQQFEDSWVEREVDIRKKILKDYNRREDDFASLREYNDYLEEVETIIFNLASGVDVEETKQKVEIYKRENQALIMKNRARQLRHEQLLTKQLEIERDERDLRNRQAQMGEEEAARQKRRERENLIDELIHSDLPASEVLASHAAATSTEVENISTLKTDITQPTYHGHLGTAVFDPLPTEAGTLYTYQPLSLTETYGPGVPDLEELESYGYLSNIRGVDEQNLGSGFQPAYACQRALQEAFSCLLLPPEDR